MRIPHPFLAGIALLAFFPLTAAPATIPTVGFEDDVDLVVSGEGEFLVMCEEDEDGSPAFVRIFDLDPATGEILALRYTEEVPGFENGVDPIIVNQMEGSPVAGYSVLVPIESENGLVAGILALRVDRTGAVLERRSIDLQGLGFREDTDGIANVYPDIKTALFPLETEDRGARGVIAIDVDWRDIGAGADWGTCTLLSSDGRPLCEENWVADWLPGLADGVDPVAYNTGFSLRLALPVVANDGACDLLMMDFDPTLPAGEPPDFMPPHVSVKSLNAASARPLAFPGYERDVDIHDFDAFSCGFGADRMILVPVEGPGDVADLYLIDGLGNSHFVYSLDGGANARPLLGYEAGVDLVPWCGAGGVPADRLLVPTENAAGTDADLYVLDVTNLTYLARAENAVVNPGLTVPGYEIGIDPLLWGVADVLVPVEGPATAGLLDFHPDLSLASSLFDGPVLGFTRSVDPIVAPLPDPDRRTFVPVGKDDLSDANVLVLAGPPDVTVSTSLEALNPGLTFSGFEWDVDPGLVNKSAPGGAWIYVPEEGAAGGQLRVEPVPLNTSGRILAIPTRNNGALSSKLYFFKTDTGAQVATFDLFGLETGLDLANGRGPTIFANPPEAFVRPGYDADTDPTLAWLPGNVGVGARPGMGRIWCASPMRPPIRIGYSVPRPGYIAVEVWDAAGRLVRALVNGPGLQGDHSVPWDGRDVSGHLVPAGIYFLSLHGAWGKSGAKAVVLR